MSTDKYTSEEEKRSDERWMKSEAERAARIQKSKEEVQERVQYIKGVWKGV